MYVLVVLGLKCTVAALRAAPGESCCVSERAVLRLEKDWTDGRTDGRKTVTLR